MYKWLVCLLISVLCSSCTQITTQSDVDNELPKKAKFSAEEKQQLHKLYTQPERSVTVTVTESNKLHTIPKGFAGINMSYFNTTDDMWEKYDLLSKLKAANVGSMRYPGGEETSFFHWQYPGVNGYEDIWDAPKEHGTSPGRGRFQVTWVDPSEWQTNDSFLSLDEFMQKCTAIDAEPILGINLSSGKKHNRQADGINEALEMMRYCQTKNYIVKYWFLDNEPWNHEAHYQFNGQQYKDEVIAYGKAIKKEFPNAKLIVNPTTSGSYNWWQGLEEFVHDTGDVIDYLDVHWYWAWGQGSFDLWADQQPLRTGDKWKRKEWDRPYADDIRMIKETIAKAGYPEIGLVVLEWNIAPSKWTYTFNQSLIAIIQAELLMEYASAGVELTCLWPFIWRSDRDVWSEQDSFPGIVTQNPPYNPTLSCDMFQMVSNIQQSTVLQSQSDNQDLRVLVTENAKGIRHILLINKNALRRKVTINFEGEISKITASKMIAMKNQVLMPCTAEINQSGDVIIFTEPYSFVFISAK